MPSESKQARETQKQTYQAAIYTRRNLLVERGVEKDRIPKDPHLKHLQAKLRKTTKRLTALADLEKQKVVLKPAVLRQRERELQEKYVKLQETYMKLQQDLAKKEAQLVQKIFSKASPAIKAIAREKGFTMILEKNVFVDRILPGSILRQLSAAEMDEYRRPFLTPGEDRRPTLTWPRQIPLGGEPADVVEIAAAYSRWLENSEVPKLFINAEPGAILTGPMRETARGFPNQTEVTVKGLHFIQEDAGAEIGLEIMNWIKKHR